MRQPKPRKRLDWAVCNPADREAMLAENMVLLRDRREGEPLIRATVRPWPRKGDLPGGMGPTPKGVRQTWRHAVPRPAKIVNRWADAEHARERERRLRQMGRAA